MHKYTMRAVELHDFTQIWDLDEIRNKLNFMVRNNMNALVFHEPGIEDKIVFPGKFLGATDEAKSYYDVFLQIDHNIYNHALRENLNLNRRAYMNHLIREAAEAGVEVYFENKELWFSDFILKFKPELVKDGVLCPSDPFWWEEFLPAKYKELFIALPDLAGIVVSIGTGESRLAISNTFACGCERCKKLDPVEWYKNMIMAMYKPFKEAGKKLIIRDFIYSKEEQERFAKAFNELPDDIVLSLKNTPHDFYPTFPDNPLIGGVNNHPQCIEYDVNGQFFGWGAAPSTMLKDIKRRLKYGAEHNVTGFIARTDWEGVQDYTCFDNLNMLNLYAIAAYSQNLDAEAADIYYKWLSEEKMLKDDIAPQEIKACINWISDIMEQTWPIIENTVFINGTVFSNDSCVHVSLGQPAFIGETHHSLKNWDPDKKDVLAMTEENILEILAGRDKALQQVDKLYNKLLEGNKGLNEAAYQKVVEQFEFMCMYVRAFRLTSRAYCFARYLKESGTDSKLQSKPVIELLKQAANEIEEFKEQLKSCPFMKKYPYDEMLEIERFECYVKDIRKIC